MSILKIALSQLIVLLLFIIIGLVFRKTDILPSSSIECLSKLEKNFLMPALVFDTFSEKFNREIIASKSNIILWGIAVAIICVAISYPLSGLFSKDNYEKKIYRYSLAIPNIGFMGYPIVQSIFGQDMLFDYMIFVIPINTIVYTWGIAQIVPSSENKRNIKSLFNAVNVAMIVGMIFGLLNITIPSPVKSTITSASSCLAPLAMLLTGLTIGNYNLFSLVMNIKVLITSLFRLILIPAFIIMLMIILKIDNNIRLLTLCMACMPLGLNTIIFPASYGKDTSLGASMALVSHVLSVITIPLMLMIFS